MKKFLAWFLVLALVAAIALVVVFCGKDDGNDNGGATTTPDEYIGIPTTPPASTPAPTTPAPTTPAPEKPEDYTWTQGNGELVYVRCDVLNVRESTSTSSNKVGQIKFGESFTRVRYNSVWTEISYNGGNYYVASFYVTNEPGAVVFEDFAEEEQKTMYIDVNTTLNLRTSTIIDDIDGESFDNVGCIAKRGAQVVQVGVSENGKWAKLTFECGTDNPEHEHGFLYCNVAYLSETVPSETPDEPSDEVEGVG